MKKKQNTNRQYRIQMEIKEYKLKNIECKNKYLYNTSNKKINYCNV